MRAAFARLLVLGLAGLATACGGARPPCTGRSACATANGEGTCLGGTCTTLAELPGPSATRVVASPIAIAWVRRGSDSRDSIATLGGTAQGKVLLRFSVPIPDGERLVAAQLLFSRVPIDAPLAEGMGAGVLLHPERIVDSWDERNVNWANQPRTFDVGFPRVRVDRVDPGASRVRIDVRELVARWSRHDPSDQGIAVSGDGSPPVAVALAPLGGDVVLEAGDRIQRPLRGPELELYFASTSREDPRAVPVKPEPAAGRALGAQSR